jgi:hypothetical protein
MMALYPHRLAPEAAMLSIPRAVARIKGRLAESVPEALIRRACRDAGHAWRDRTLGPVATTFLLLRQVLHGNPAVGGLRRLCGLDFSDSAYCQARARLPLAVLRRLLRVVTGRLRAGDADDPAARWRGRRVYLLDGSGFSMPDTPQLQEAFGQPGGQAAGRGFPVARLLVRFDAYAGYLLTARAAPLRTHDLSRAACAHAELGPGDLLVGDRAFASYAHLALCRRRGLHAVFRAHQRRAIDFGPGGRRLKRLGRHDQLVAYTKPAQRPGWMSAADFAALPAALVVRELRSDVRPPGRRTRRVTLATTLLDPRRYPARALAELYGRRWQAETGLRHLKQTLGMDVLRCRTVFGVLKELTAFAVVYNLVRRVMREAGRRQAVAPGRISFIDALRWLRHARPGEALPRLKVNPGRPGRVEPRVRKRRPKEFPLMKRPRAELRQALFKNRPAA